MHSDDADNPPRFIALDSLRGVAALMVAAYHIVGSGYLLSLPLVRQGWLFVDFFFVLSGFVIAASYGSRLREGFPVGRFMFLRLGRVYPLYLAMLGAYLMIEIGFWLFGSGGIVVRQPFTGERSLELLLAGVLMVQWLAMFPGNGWNVPGWSVAVEIWLYLGIALIWRLAGRSGWIVAMTAATAAAALILADVDAFPDRMLRGIVGFGMGVVAWRIWETGPGAFPRRLPATATEAAMVAAVIAAVSLADKMAAAAVLCDLVFVAAVLIFAREGGAISALLRRPAFVWGGVLSYSIYMVHGMVIGRGLDALRFVAAQGGPAFAEMTSRDGISVRRITAVPLLTDLIALGLLAACVAVAWVTWRLIEEPCRQWSRRRAAEMGVAREEAAAPAI